MAGAWSSTRYRSVRDSHGLCRRQGHVARGAVRQTLGWWRIPVRHSKMTNDEFIRQIFDELLTNLHSKIRQNSSKLVRVRQNSSPFVKISSKFVKISSKFVKKFVMKSGFTAMNSKICRKKRRVFLQKIEFWVVQRNAQRVDFEKCWKMRLVSLS